MRRPLVLALVLGAIVVPVLYLRASLDQILDWLRPADLTPRPPLQMGAGERNCRRVQPF